MCPDVSVTHVPGLDRSSAWLSVSEIEGEALTLLRATGAQCSVASGPPERPTARQASPTAACQAAR